MWKNGEENPRIWRGVDLISLMSPFLSRAVDIPVVSSMQELGLCYPGLSFKGVSISYIS